MCAAHGGGSKTMTMLWSGTMRIAWRSLLRNPRRTVLAAAAIAVGQAAVLISQGLMRGYARNMQRVITGPLIGDIQIHARGWREEQALDMTIPEVAQKVARIRTLPGVRAVAARVYAPVLAAPRQAAYAAVLVGIDPRYDVGPDGIVPPNAPAPGTRRVLVGSRLARKIGVRAGDELALVGQAWDGAPAADMFRVAAVVTSPVDLVNQSGIVMRLTDAREFLAMPDAAHEIVVRTDDPSLPALTPLVQRLRADPAFRGLEVLPWQEAVPELAGMIRLSVSVGWFVLAIVLIAALAGIINTLLMATYERVHEFGMLLALGCRPGRLVRLVLFEAAFLASVGAMAGTVLGWGFVVASRRAGGIDMASWGGKHAADLAWGGMRIPLCVQPFLSPVDPVVGIVAILMVSLAAAAWPASVAARLDPVEALRS